jgi:hypothetical protein
MPTLPWPKPISTYDSDGPRHRGTPLDFDVAGVAFRVAPTAEVAITTGRTRFHVQCRTCLKTLHEATTGPSCRIRDHLKSEHGFEGELAYEEDGSK